jgi:hypothetical protein
MEPVKIAEAVLIVVVLIILFFPYKPKNKG